MGQYPTKKSIKKGEKSPLKIYSHIQETFLKKNKFFCKNDGAPVRKNTFNKLQSGKKN